MLLKIYLGWLIFPHDFIFGKNVMEVIWRSLLIASYLSGGTFSSAPTICYVHFGLSVNGCLPSFSLGKFHFFLFVINKHFMERYLETLRLSTFLIKIYPAIVGNSFKFWGKLIFMMIVAQ
jgi:hypothetical protein